jgi:hypothetical protein
VAATRSLRASAQTAVQRCHRRRCTPPPIGCGYCGRRAGPRSCKPGTGIYAALQRRSVTQRAECIEGRQRRHSRSHRSCPLRASCRAQRGRGGPKAARRSGRQLMQPQAAPGAALHAREPHSTPQHAECREGRQRRYIASGVAHPQQGPAALSEAGTVLRPSDALATCSCELQAVPHAPLRAGEPHSAPQHSAARRLPPEPLAASHRPPRAYPQRRPVAHGAAGTVLRPSATMAIGSCEPEAAHSAALPVREPHSVPQPAAARRSPRGSPEALQPLQPTCPLEGVLPRSTRQGRPLRPPGALAISSCELQAAPNATPCAESLTARRSAQSAARGARGVTSPPALLTLSKVLPRSAKQGRS